MTEYEKGWADALKVAAEIPTIGAGMYRNGRSQQIDPYDARRAILALKPKQAKS